MRNMKKIRLFPLILALALALTAIPLSAALADDEVERYTGEDTADGIVDSRESEYLQTATGYAGDKVTVYVPVKNVSSGSLSDMTCVLPVSDDITVFPFENSDATATELEWNAYQKADKTTSTLVSWDGSALAAGEHAYFKLDVTFAAGVTQGNYTLPFTIRYNSGSTSTVEVMVYCRGVQTSGSSGSSYKSKPKVIIESYQFMQDTIYAGDTVQLQLIIANTSSREAITNLQLDYANDAGAILPAPGSSSSVYIGTIDKNGVCALTLNLQIAPDATAQSQMLAVTLSYEGTKNKQEFEETASVSVPVQQKMRVRINDPVVYDDPWVGSTVSVGVTLYNLGKSTLYNCMVDMVGDGFTLEETYFGGNISSGGTMRADLSVTPTMGGELDAQVRVTYEDVNGNQTEELLPLDMFVNEDTAMNYASGGDAITDMGDQPANANIGWIFWVLGGAAALTGLIFLGIRIKKNRERALEDL